ncbi:RNA polymerase II mediator complex subunit [Sporothrix epigloea]|uniref:Mediator of RNA polymerase II transcription subunit 10 n=1 Tax=Sporothrix epigloea TaxID=1892477 RepID=A0ABP0DRM4_9PEZI
MAPIGHSATAQAEVAIRDTIQSLYNVMLHTSAYDAAAPDTSLDALVTEVRILSQSLRDVNEVVEQDGGATSLDSNPAGRGLPAIPRDLVQYVEAGRNPDIYTREFVELVRRTNQLRAGKSRAFAQFRDTLAGQIRSALPELSGDVDRIMMDTTAETQSESGAGAEAGEGQQRPGHELGEPTTLPLSGSAEAAHGRTASANANATDAVGSHVILDHGSATPTANGNANATANSIAGAANMDTGRSLTASASASPAQLGGIGNGTPIDMLGILPSTPQPYSTSSALGGAGSSGSTGEGEAVSGDGTANGQDAMEI